MRISEETSIKFPEDFVPDWVVYNATPVGVSYNGIAEIMSYVLTGLTVEAVKEAHGIGTRASALEGEYELFSVIVNGINARNLPQVAKGRDIAQLRQSLLNTFTESDVMIPEELVAACAACFPPDVAPHFQSAGAAFFDLLRGRIEVGVFGEPRKGVQVIEITYLDHYSRFKLRK